MKKNYIKPKTNSYANSMTGIILSGSGTTKGLPVEDEYDEEDITYSKNYVNLSCWDDEDEAAR